MGVKSSCHQSFPGLVLVDRRHRYAPFGQRPLRLRLSRVAALVALKAMETRAKVLAALKLRPLERRRKIRPNRTLRGSPEQRRSAVQSPERAWRAVSDVRMGEAKPFENTLFPRRDGRISVFAMVIVAEGTGLVSNLLHIKRLILIYYFSRNAPHERFQHCKRLTW